MGSSSQTRTLIANWAVLNVHSASYVHLQMNETDVIQAHFQFPISKIAVIVRREQPPRLAGSSTSVSVSYPLPQCAVPRLVSGRPAAWLRRYGLFGAGSCGHRSRLSIQCFVQVPHEASDPTPGSGRFARHSRGACRSRGGRRRPSLRSFRQHTMVPFFKVKWNWCGAWRCGNRVRGAKVRDLGGGTLEGVPWRGPGWVEHEDALGRPGQPHTANMRRCALGVDEAPRLCAPAVGFFPQMQRGAHRSPLQRSDNSIRSDSGSGVVLPLLSLESKSHMFLHRCAGGEPRCP